MRNYSQNHCCHKGPQRVLSVALAAIVGLTAGGFGLAWTPYSVRIVEGSSMVPTYQSGSRIFTSPIWGRLERGDIVVLKAPNDDYELKRIIAMPRETVCFVRGRVFINGALLHEPYLTTFDQTFPGLSSNTSTYELSNEQYLVLGDNRLNSRDSRTYGPVSRKQIKRRVPVPESIVRPFLTAVPPNLENSKTLVARVP